MTDSQYLGTVQIWQNLNENHYFLTSTKSVICQIAANCSPFQSLNMLPFHVRLGCLKLICHNLISFFCKNHLKLAQYLGLYGNLNKNKSDKPNKTKIE